MLELTGRQALGWGKEEADRNFPLPRDALLPKWQASQGFLHRTHIMRDGGQTLDLAGRKLAIQHPNANSLLMGNTHHLHILPHDILAGMCRGFCRVALGDAGPRGL